MNDKQFLKRTRAVGFVVDPNIDDPTGVECPRLRCNEIVVYNGNYFCRCGWEFPSDAKLNRAQVDFLHLLVEGLYRYRISKGRRVDHFDLSNLHHSS